MWIAGIRDVRDARAHQRPLVRIQLPLDRVTDWRTATFTPRHPGAHAIVLESSDPSAPLSTGLFGGAFEVEIRDPHGRIVFERSVDGQAIEHPVPSGVATTEVGRFNIQDAGLGVWAFTARVLRGDPRFAPALSTVYISPPARLDVGLHIFGVVLSVGVMAVIGALLLGGGAWTARRQHRKAGVPEEQ